MSQLIWREGRLPGVDSLEWLVWSVTVIGLACAVGPLFV